MKTLVKVTKYKKEKDKQLEERSCDEFFTHKEIYLLIMLLG